MPLDRRSLLHRADEPERSGKDEDHPPRVHLLDPRARVLGLSKFARIAQRHAHRLQLQEGLVRGIADELSTASGSGDVAVLAEGEHLCLTMRGARAPAVMASSVLRGAFKDDASARQELLLLAARKS